jgi:hypothetical protein
MATILEDAVRVYRERATAETARDRELLRDVESWFTSDDTAYVFSFRRISHELGIDPGWFRQVLARWRSYQHALREGVPRLAHAERLAS